MRVPSTPIFLTAAALSLAGNVASSTTASASGNKTETAPSTNNVASPSNMPTSSSMASMSSSTSTANATMSSVPSSPSPASGKPAARRNLASAPQASSKIEARFNKDRYAVRSSNPVQAAADQSGSSSQQQGGEDSELGGDYEDWEEAAGRKHKHHEHEREKRNVLEAWESTSRHGNNRWRRDTAGLQAKGLIKIRSRPSSLQGRSTTAPLQEADKSKDKPKLKPATKPKEVPGVEAEEDLEDAEFNDMDFAGEDGDDEADVSALLEDRRRSITSSGSVRRGSANRLNLNGRRSKPSSRRGSFEEVNSEDDSSSDSISTPSSASRRHNVKRLLDLQLGGGTKPHAHATVADDDDEDCEADDESVDQSSNISISSRDQGDEEEEAVEDAVEEVTPKSASGSFPPAGMADSGPLSPTLDDLKWQDEQLRIAINAIETLNGVGTTTGRKAKTGGSKQRNRQKRQDNVQGAMQDLDPGECSKSSVVRSRFQLR